ncbi:hypothetical protein LJC21_01850 [Bacteroides sp. OttesenSCG-928-E20]|nr:hypothetical protein [Bacteroides sp. OttesenSCG-928-E20]MDL2304428.1 hypothetical protein [Bacteroides sp. OttesenSCG-928-D19]
MKCLFNFLLLLSLSLNAYAQWTPEILLTSPTIPEADNNKLTVDIEAIGFFKNNEYFSPVSLGQTFPGIFIRPRIACQIDNKLRLELGMTGLYFSGDQQKDGLSVFNSVFARIQYAIRPNFHLVFGNYYDGANHRLIEPLYRWEQQLIESPESGLQLLYNTDRVFADIWLNWQRYIEHGDSVPEALTFGASASYRLTDEARSFKLAIPAQLTIYHQGGQIDTSNEKKVVTINAATGVNMEWRVSRHFIRSIGFDAYLVGYYDKLPNSEVRPYSKGWGIYPVFKLNAKYFKFMTGYWYARNFYSSEGDPLFASFNPRYPEANLPTRQMITSKLTYFKPLHKAFSLGGQVEMYYDTKLKQFDYSFGINLRLNTQLFSKRL